MRQQEIVDYHLHDTQPFEKSAFHKWFMESMAEGKFDVGYESKWDLMRNFNKSKQKED